MLPHLSFIFSLFFFYFSFFFFFQKKEKEAKRKPMYLAVIFINFPINAHSCRYITLSSYLFPLVPIYRPLVLYHFHSCRYITLSSYLFPLVLIYCPLVHIQPTYTNITPFCTMILFYFIPPKLSNMVSKSILTQCKKKWTFTECQTKIF